MPWRNRREGDTLQRLARVEEAVSDIRSIKQMIEQALRSLSVIENRHEETRKDVERVSQHLDRHVSDVDTKFRDFETKHDATDRSVSKIVWLSVGGYAVAAVLWGVIQAFAVREVEAFQATAAQTQ